MEFNGFKVDIEEKSQIIDLENQDFNFMIMVKTTTSSSVTSGAASNFRVFVALSNTQSRIFRKSGSNLLHDRYRSLHLGSFRLYSKSSLVR